MDATQLLAFLNAAGREELTALPGVGPALAQRLMTARPFGSLDAVRAVQGVSAGLLEKIQAAAPPEGGLPEAAPHEAGEPAPEPSSRSARDLLRQKGQEAQQAIRGGFAGLGAAVNRGGQTARRAVESLPGTLEQVSRSRGPGWTLLVSSGVSILVAVILTLAVLGGINGSLRFGTASESRSLQREAAQLAARVETMQQDLTGLRTRVDTLEGLGARMVALEKSQAQLSTDIRTASRAVASMQTDIGVLQERTGQLEERTQRFETFLKDLQTLLAGLLAPAGGTE